MLGIVMLMPFQVSVDACAQQHRFVGEYMDMKFQARSNVIYKSQAYGVNYIQIHYRSLSVSLLFQTCS